MGERGPLAPCVVSAPAAAEGVEKDHRGRTAPDRSAAVTTSRLTGIAQPSHAGRDTRSHTRGSPRPSPGLSDGTRGRAHGPPTGGVVVKGGGARDLDGAPGASGRERARCPVSPVAPYPLGPIADGIPRVTSMCRPFGERRDAAALREWRWAGRSLLPTAYVGHIGHYGPARASKGLGRARATRVRRLATLAP